MRLKQIKTYSKSEAKRLNHKEGKINPTISRPTKLKMQVNQSQEGKE
jgi:hypothetical protein